MICAVNLRVARHTDRLEEIVGFYRDGIGLRQIGSFQGHDGYDGVFLEIPGTGAHLEFTTGGAHEAPAAHPESLLVLYLDSREELDEIVARLRRPQVVPANPYWRRTAAAFTDPDGFQVLLVPRRPG